MSDQHLTVSDWFAVIVTGIIAGISSAMAWVSGKERAIRKDLGDRMAIIESIQSKHADIQSEQKIELAVIHSNHVHVTERMDEVREIGLSAHRKLDELLREVKRH